MFADFLVNFLKNLFLNLLYLLRLRRPAIKPEETTMYLITVNYNIKKINGHLKIGLNRDSKIADAKQIIVNELNKLLLAKFNDGSDSLRCDQIAIIFAGQELDDQTRIANYDLGQNSIINVVRITEKLIASKQADLFQSALLLSTNSQSNDNRQEDEIEEDGFVHLISPPKPPVKSNAIKLSEDKRAFFFVYCSAKSCRKITTGKLRVRCAACKEHSLIVVEHPKSFDDVLLERRIKGKCQNHPCKGIWASFYFKCSSKEHQGEVDQRTDEKIDRQKNDAQADVQLNERALSLQSIKHNSRLTRCPVCDETKETIFLFKCGHPICLDCFQLFCESKLNSRELVLVDSIGYTVNCVFDCSDSFVDDTHYFHILSNRDYERYQDFGAEEYVLKNGVICPQANCSQGMLIDKNEASACKKICCVSCGFLFCTECKAAYHEGECSSDLLLDSIRTNSANTPKTFGQLLKEKLSVLAWNTWNKDEQKENGEIVIKRCPGCKCPTERNDGCLHITCKICNLNWCFLCEKEWSYDCMGMHWFD